MIRLLTLVAIVALVVSGCSSSKRTPSADAVGPTASRTAESPAAEPPKPEPPKTATPPPKNELPIRVNKPDPAAFEIEQTGDGTWKVAKLDGAYLAKKVANAIQGLKGTNARTLTTLTVPGGSGQVQSDVKIQNARTYSIQYPIVGRMPELCEVVADGAAKAYKGPKGTIDTKRPISSPGPDAQISSSTIVQKWPLEFPRLLYRGLVEGKDAWSPLINQLMSPRSGFKTEISERTMTYKERPIKSIRLIARRNPQEAKKLGPCEIEMVFDGHHYLPVTIRVNTQIPNEGEYKIYWTTHWLFKKTFKPEEFRI